MPSRSRRVDVIADDGHHHARWCTATRSMGIATCPDALTNTMDITHATCLAHGAMAIEQLERNAISESEW